MPRHVQKPKPIFGTTCSQKDSMATTVNMLRPPIRNSHATTTASLTNVVSRCGLPASILSIEGPAVSTAKAAQPVISRGKRASQGEAGDEWSACRSSSPCVDHPEPGQGQSRSQGQGIKSLLQCLQPAFKNVQEV